MRPCPQNIETMRLTAKILGNKELAVPWSDPRLLLADFWLGRTEPVCASWFPQ